MTTPTFIVGTGRCGSTMLSNMLREHPAILSISEFLTTACDMGPFAVPRFPSKSIDGPDFWKMVSTIDPLLTIALRNRLDIPEIIYPVEVSTARFTLESGIPLILTATLPHLTQDPDELFDLLQSELLSWPMADLGQHYAHLFDWLRRHFGKQIWVERSGGSIANVCQFVELFPDARFIHMVRDGRDVALSMHKHLLFRLVFAMMTLTEMLGVNPYLSADRSRVDNVPDELRCFLPEQFDAHAIRAFQMPLSFFGKIWAENTVKGLEAVNDMASDRLMTIKYEGILAEPKRQLDGLAAFLGEEFIDEDWSVRCAATVRQPKSTWRDLPNEDAETLTEACRPGFEALAAAGVEYEF